MESNPLVSVLMTAYNREKYIKEAIESVLASEYSNFELIIVDDCSTDDTLAIAHSLMQQDSRIKIFKNEVNIGQFPNRNRAIQLSKGKFIKFLDSDDKISPHGLSRMVESLQKFPDAGIGFPVKEKTENFPYKLEPHDSISFHFKGKNHLTFGPTATIFTKAALERVGGFEAEYGILTDSLLNLKIASLFPTVFFEQGLYLWRRHSDQVTEEQKNDVKMIKERYMILKTFLSWSLAPLNNREINEIRNNYMKINTAHFLKHFFRGAFRSAFTIKKNTELSFLELFKSVMNPSYRYRKI